MLDAATRSHEHTNGKFMKVLVTCSSMKQYIDTMHLFLFVQMTDKPEEVATRRSAVHFAAFPKGDGEESQFFLFVEGNILCHTASFSKSLILWFAVHYILNLEYIKEMRSLSVLSGICLRLTSVCV